MDDIRDKRLTILYVEDDDDTRHVMKQLLTRSGYHVVLSINEEDALNRSTDGRVATDLILIDFGWPVANVLAAGRHIREQAALRTDVPLVIIAFKFEAEMEGQNVNVGDNAWVTYLEDGEQLKQLLAHLLTTHPATT